MGAAQVFLWCVTAWWGLASLYAILNRLLIPRLPKSAPDDEPLPSLSVVIPARNEASGIEAAVISHCSQDYPNLQVVVCDDGSTDETPQILAKLQKRFANLVIVKGTEPLDGWLGKPNAMREALEAASGEIILFVDADVRYAPGVHRRAAVEMERGGHDFLLLLSTLEGKGLEPLVTSFLDAFALYSVPTFLANCRLLRWFAFGAGSGNLVRRETLEAAGGIESIKSEVVDDVALGKKIKGWRGRFRFVTAFGDVRVRMYPSFKASIHGFTKNLYSAFDRNVLFGSAGFAADAAVHVAPPLALALSAVLPSCSLLFIPALASTAAGFFCNLQVSMWSGQPWWIAFLFPARTAVWIYIFLRSTANYRRSGISWRGRTYNLGGKR